MLKMSLRGEVGFLRYARNRLGNFSLCHCEERSDVTISVCVIASEAWQSHKKYLQFRDNIISLYEIAALPLVVRNDNKRSRANFPYEIAALRSQ